MKIASFLKWIGLAGPLMCAAVLSAQTTSTLTVQTANNTSACSAVGTPSYCFLVPDLTTQTANAHAQTKNLTPVGNVSQRSIKGDYLYSGATTRLIAAYQPWFGPESGTEPCYPYLSGGDITESLHPCTGYNENTAAVVALQHSKMIGRGFTDVSPDWYGDLEGGGFTNATVIAEAANLASRSGYPLKLMIMIDKGLILDGMSTDPTTCPQNSSATTTCIVNVLNAAYDYINTNWGTKPYYSTDASGNPMSLTFIDECSWPNTYGVANCNPVNPGNVDWPTVWAEVKAHMSTYAKSYKIVKEFGNFTEANIDGAYIWPQASAYSDSSPNSQYCWAWPGSSGSSCATYDYITSYYSAAEAAYKSNPNTIQMGGMYTGFDGSNNNYNQHLMARQCGQLFVDLGNAIKNASPTPYSTTNQLPWLIFPTWNDLGEGTNIEGGVDNCWRINTPTMAGSVATWTQIDNDPLGYASPSTISTFSIWYGSGNGDLTLSQSGIGIASHCNAGATTCSFDLSTATHPPPAGKTWKIYIQQIPKALLFTEINGGGNGNGVPGTYTH
jgi:hypothetical protein